MRKIIVKIQYIVFALKKINKIHLGNVVIYNGEKCKIIQGVADPLYNLLPLYKENLEKPKRVIYEQVDESNFKVEKSFKNYCYNFKFDYNFLMRYWYSIDTRNKMFSRITYKN